MTGFPHEPLFFYWAFQHVRQRFDSDQISLKSIQEYVKGAESDKTRKGIWRLTINCFWPISASSISLPDCEVEAKHFCQDSLSDSRSWPSDKANWSAHIAEVHEKMSRCWHRNSQLISWTILSAAYTFRSRKRLASFLINSPFYQSIFEP